MTVILPILVSLALLFGGRKLFWFAIGVLGFYLGMKIAPMFIDTTQAWTMILISLGVGALSALVAILLQKIAVGIAGFLLGSYGAFIGMNKIGLTLGSMSWLPIVCFGVLGVILAAIVFEWALILFSSLAGAYLFVTTLNVTPSLEFPLFVVSAIAGIVVQAKSKGKKKPDGGKEKKDKEKEKV